MTRIMIIVMMVRMMMVMTMLVMTMRMMTMLMVMMMMVAAVRWGLRSSAGQIINSSSHLIQT